MARDRAIFEEIAQASSSPKRPPPPQSKGDPHRPLRALLGILFALVSGMILLGGLTRLTDSGLSITDWSPIMGALPPLNTQDWHAAFTRYQETYEFSYQNSAITLEGFKKIFWWEWGHRQIGRLIGLVWAVGFLSLWLCKALPVGWAGRMFLLGGLGGFQGFLGWWMVKSGLSGQMIDVAAYRLAIHLGMAFLILGLIYWYYETLRRSVVELLQSRRGRRKVEIRVSALFVGMTFVQILSGALVAGLDAGRGHTDWPFMLGRFFPKNAFQERPWVRNFFENPGLVQFDHRMIAYILLALALWFWWRMRAKAQPAFCSALTLVVLALLGQAVLGIITVVNGAPWQLGILHQSGAILLWIIILRTRVLAAYPPALSLRN